MKRPCDAGKWWVSLNGREVFRGHGRGPAVSYASSLALVSVFDRQVVMIEVGGPQGVVWRYEEGRADLDLEDPVLAEGAAAEVSLQEEISAAGSFNG